MTDMEKITETDTAVVEATPLSAMDNAILRARSSDELYQLVLASRTVNLCSQSRFRQMARLWLCI